MLYTYTQESQGLWREACFSSLPWEVWIWSLLLPPGHLCCLLLRLGRVCMPEGHWLGTFAHPSPSVGVAHTWDSVCVFQWLSLIEPLGSCQNILFFPVLVHRLKPDPGACRWCWVHRSCPVLGILVLVEVGSLGFSAEHPATSPALPRLLKAVRAGSLFCLPSPHLWPLSH